jgi:hypothetical protein
VKSFGLIALVAVLAGCGSNPPAPKAEAPPPAPVKDRSVMMPLDGRVSTKTVPNHILGIAALPGGTLGDYDVKGRKYQLFIIDTETNQQSAFSLLDAKAALQNPEYIAYMGGYFGTMNDAGKQPLYVFSKLHYLAGVVGLSKDDADPIARTLAARLR